MQPKGPVPPLLEDHGGQSWHPALLSLHVLGGHATHSVAPPEGSTVCLPVGHARQSLPA